VQVLGRTGDGNCSVVPPGNAPGSVDVRH